MFDLIIVGGGPAGSTLARLLGNKYKILLLEKRNFENLDNTTNQKCCGGLLAPDAQKMLARFGLGIPKTVLLSPQLFAVRTIDMNNSLERFYQRHYININRDEFDKWLISLIPPKVEIMTECLFQSYEMNGQEIIVNFICDGKKCSEKTKILVGADGGNSKVRSAAFQNYAMPKKYVAIQEWFEIEDNMPYYGAIFDNEITDFYSWTIPKDNYLILGTALEIDKKTNEKFELLKLKMQRYGFDFGKSVRRNGAFILRPENTKQICMGVDNIILIGEAAGFISPSSAEGMSYAFKSALALAQALEHETEAVDKKYKKFVKPLIRNIEIKNLKSPAMYNLFIRKQIMKSGIMSLNIFRPNGFKK